MKWSQTPASKCKWSKYTEEMFKNWEIVWDQSLLTQVQPPHCVEFIATKEGKIAYMKYAYNPNTGKDRFEQMTDDQRRRNISMKVEVFDDVLDFKGWVEHKNDNRLRKAIV